MKSIKGDASSSVSTAEMPQECCTKLWERRGHSRVSHVRVVKAAWGPGAQGMQGSLRYKGKIPCFEGMGGVPRGYEISIHGDP